MPYPWVVFRPLLLGVAVPVNEVDIYFAAVIGVIPNSWGLGVIAIGGEIEREREREREKERERKRERQKKKKKEQQKAGRQK